MKRAALLAWLALSVLAPAAPQQGASRPSDGKESLAILPFTGGRGNDGETIAELFSQDGRIIAMFSPIPRTMIAGAVSREQGFQMGSGMTDPDTIASIGRQLGARYVAAGTITALGNRKLLIISIMNIENLRLAAGDYAIYANIEEIPARLPRMAENVIRGIQGSALPRPGLAVVPVQIQGGADRGTADVLAQALSIHLIRTGAYAIYPRTSSLEQARAEQRTQLGGLTADEQAVPLGRGENPRLVLSVRAASLGRRNMFIAAIMNLETGVQVAGSRADYRNIGEGLGAMETLAWDLTSTEEEIRQRRLAGARFSSVGITAGSSFAAPWAVAGIGGTFSPLPYLFMDAGFDIGFVHGYAELGDAAYVNLYPFAHVNGYLPLGGFLGLYLGAGGGYMIAHYWTDDEDSTPSFPVFDAAAGFYLGRKNHYFRLGYSLRTTFAAVNHKIAVGYSYRFE